MNDPHFFGYGSLVNLKTHDYRAPQPARLTGWRRVWRFTNARPVAYLSVEPCADCTIDGVIAQVPNADWAALDVREEAYARRDVTAQVSVGKSARNIAVYQVPDQPDAPSKPHPILLSYLDVVVQGYLNLFGENGAEAFFATTHGWDSPILNDRENAQYPRHQSLSDDERAVVDRLLKTWSTAP